MVIFPKKNLSLMKACYFYCGLVGLLTVCCVAAPLIYINQIVNRKNWNHGAIRTKCSIVDYDIVTIPCKQPQFNCFNGFILVNYTVDNTNHIHRLKIYEEEKDPTIMSTKLNQKYPLSTDIDCFYDKNNPSDVKLDLDDTRVAYGFFYFFISFGIFIFVVILIILFIRYFNSKFY